ncbi:hypothetical protein [Aporhodopirellula aestuarii]|uniref:EF-hand domain-containing protein n=1 Tax=Aporhodopirellula aestuarii TaxID=2950107 RepID=A0ABT0U8X1_9BACT|nr:hypothetical protein [Aporhodopirellula aestuarii]MCM2373262.1 hypothetical protein [Aporhodopirellula aestuarii]
MQLDANDDGELSAEELSSIAERGQRMFQWADEDKDGALSKKELETMKTRGEAMRQGRGGRDDEQARD